MNNNSAITSESTSLLERVMQAKKCYRLTIAMIAKQAGMFQPTVTNQLNGKYNIDVRVLLAIANLCSDLSCDWLLRGDGDMQVNKIAAPDEKQLEKLTEPIWEELMGIAQSQQAMSNKVRSLEQTVSKIINLIDK